MPFRVADELREFVPFILRFIAYLTTHMQRFGISQATLDALTALHTPFAAAYETYADRATQTDIAREAVWSAYKPLKAEVRRLQQSIKHNVEAQLTDEDRAELDIHKDKETRTRAPRPEFSPMETAIESTRERTKWASRVPEGREIDHNGMPIGAPRLMREIAVTDNAETAPTDADWHAIDTVGRSEHVVMWPEGSSNRSGWLRTRYANHRGESGPYSPVAQTAIL